MDSVLPSWALGAAEACSGSKSPGAGAMARAQLEGFARRMRVCETGGTSSDSRSGESFASMVSCYRVNYCTKVPRVKWSRRAREAPPPMMRFD